ncbi:hypothetical protein [Pseudoxanthomonas japonensis]|jgi:hypothetical protein|nr:hypothetical protein [Pseudoxanthomonas japonensis]
MIMPKAERCGENRARCDALGIAAHRRDRGADMFLHTAHVESIALVERR